MAPIRPTPRLRLYGLHAVRVGLFATILVLINLQYDSLLMRDASTLVNKIDIEFLQNYIPGATTVVSIDDTGDESRILSDDGETLGRVLFTSPISDRIVGFSGPTNVRLIFDENDRLLHLGIESSADTPAHVTEVESSNRFFDTFRGRTESELASANDVDGVSGATLTSMAILESVTFRLGGSAGSLRFPHDPSVDDAREFFSNVTSIRKDSMRRSTWEVLDSSEIVLGYLVRTSPAADSVIGYQGPTNTLIAMDSSKIVSGIRLRETFDNEEYVSTVRIDDYFLSLFNGLQLSELSAMDLKEAEVEGVSGATMTSMSIARGLIRAAEANEFAIPVSNRKKPTLAGHTIGTALVVLCGCLVAFTKLRGNRYVRVAFPVILIGYLGLVNGDMLSLAMVSGWARHGIPWQGAPGLILLSAAAILVPITSRTNIYCHHLCPHGAAQQLLRRLSKKRLVIPGKVAYLLKSIPALVLGVCVLIAMTSATISLVDFEPFDAWVFRVAGASTITIAIVGLGASIFVPMAYCRFGCPTGLLLNFLRLNARSDRWGPSDWGATLLLLTSIGIWWFT